METTIFEIKLKEGQVYRVFCANRTQKLKVLRQYNKLKEEGTAIDISHIVSGIHTAKQWSEIVESNNL